MMTAMAEKTRDPMTPINTAINGVTMLTSVTEKRMVRAVRKEVIERFQDIEKERKNNKSRGKNLGTTFRIR